MKNLTLPKEAQICPVSVWVQCTHSCWCPPRWRQSYWGNLGGDVKVKGQCRGESSVKEKE
jgi:hypothetical protein